MNPFSASDAASSQDFFFKVSDRLNMESSLHSLLHEGKSLMLYCPASALVEHYGGQLIQRLRHLAPRSTVEVFFPANSEALVKRFNDVLSHLSIDVATQEANGQAPDKIWVVHDAHALPASELQLLTRLLQQFPGAQVCAILMLSGTKHPLISVDNQSRRIARWDMEVPTLELAQQALLQAQSDGRGTVAHELIQKLQLTRAPLPPAPPIAIDPDARHWDDEDAAPPAQKKSRLGAWVAGLLLMLLFSLGVTAFLQPAAFADLASQAVDWVFSTQRPKPRPEPAAPAPQPPPVPVAAPAPTPAPAPESAPVPPADAAKPDAGPNPSTPSNTAPPAPPPVAPPAGSAAPAGAPVPEKPAPTAVPPAVPAAAPPAVPPAVPTPPPVNSAEPEIVTEIPDIALKGQKWLAGLPADTFVVNHGVFAGTRDALRLINSESWLNQARVLPIYKGNNDQAEFMVVTGPFRSEERAKGFMVRLGIKARVESVPKLLPSTRNNDNKAQNLKKAAKP